MIANTCSGTKCSKCNLTLIKHMKIFCLIALLPFTEIRLVTIPSQSHYSRILTEIKLITSFSTKANRLISDVEQPSHYAPVQLNCTTIKCYLWGNTLCCSNGLQLSSYVKTCGIHNSLKCSRTEYVDHELMMM